MAQFLVCTTLFIPVMTGIINRMTNLADARIACHVLLRKVVDFLLKLDTLREAFICFALFVLSAFVLLWHALRKERLT